jgi:hypothetical protein
MNARFPAMGNQVFIVAPGVKQRIGKNRKPAIV